MKILVWFLVICVTVFLNELLGVAVGLKLGPVLLIPLIGVIAKAITGSMGSGKNQKKSEAASAAPEVPVTPPTPPVAPPVQMPQTEIPARPSAGMPVKKNSVLLTLMSGPMAGSRFRSREGMTIMIGRDPARCNLVLKGYNSVSGLHCRLTVTSRGMAITDLGSSNGTYVDGVRLQPNVPATVRDGGQIRLAGQDCIFNVTFE